jgi:hypothetical protein
MLSPDGAAMLLNSGMPLKDIAALYGVTVEEVITAIRQHAKEEREELKSVKQS